MNKKIFTTVLSGIIFFSPLASTVQAAPLNNFKPSINITESTQGPKLTNEILKTLNTNIKKQPLVNGKRSYTSPEGFTMVEETKIEKDNNQKATSRTDTFNGPVTVTHKKSVWFGIFTKITIQAKFHCTGDRYKISLKVNSFTPNDLNLRVSNGSYSNKSTSIIRPIASTSQPARAIAHWTAHSDGTADVIFSKTSDFTMDMDIYPNLTVNSDISYVK